MTDYRLKRTLLANLNFNIAVLQDIIGMSDVFRYFPIIYPT